MFANIDDYDSFIRDRILYLISFLFIYFFISLSIRNPLLPEGLPPERERKRLVISIYKAEGLPKSKLSILIR